MNHSSRVAVAVVVAVLAGLVAGLIVAILAKHDGNSYAGSALAGLIAGGGTCFAVIAGADELHLMG